MNKSVCFYLSILVLICFIPFSAKAYYFNFDLKYGDTNRDVYELQKELNRDVDTTVAGVGAGSTGEETEYFGNLTKSAVIKFQEKYYNEVLLPAGLSSGTGYVGSFTRNKLNQLSNATTSATSTISKDDKKEKVTKQPKASVVADSNTVATTSVSTTTKNNTIVINVDSNSNPTATVGNQTINLQQAVNILGGEVQKKVDQQLKNVKDEAAKEQVKAETSASYNAWGSGLIGAGTATLVLSGWTGVGLIVGLVLIIAGAVLALVGGADAGSLAVTVAVGVAGGLVGGAVGALAGGVLGGYLGGAASGAVTGGVGGAAGVSVPFGGLHVASLQCTCSGNSLHYVYDMKSMQVLALVYQAGASRLYSNYNIYASYQLGTYMRGTGICQITSGNSCVNIQADGMYGSMPGTGTSAI